MPPIRAALCAAFASLVLATAAAPSQAQDRNAMRAACGPDAARLCPGVKPGGGRIQFQNLPAIATVRIYTIAGDLVRELAKSDALTGSLDWNLKNGAGNEVSSGIYMYHVESGEGFEAKGNFVVIR